MYCSSAACESSPSVDLVRTLSARKRRLFRFAECQFSLRIAIDHDVIPFGELALENRKRERVLQQALNRPLQWTRSERRVIAFI